MFDRDLAYDIICLIIENLETIQKRTATVQTPDDFASSDSGMILLDSVCMKLVAVGESLKNLDKNTNKELLYQYPKIQWKLVMGMRDIIVHHYFDVDAEEIYKTLKEDIPLLLSVLNEIKKDIKKR